MRLIIILFIITTATPFFSFGQIVPKLIRIENSEIVDLINGIVDYESISTNTFSLTIIKSENQAGSLDTRGTHEISYKYYLAISEYDEYPTQSLFVLDKLYNPKIIDKMIASQKINLVFEVGPYGNRQQKKVSIKPHEVSVE